jgi:hypothetical protein
MSSTKNLSFFGSHFFIGIDAHLKKWKITIRFNGVELKTFSMNPSPIELYNYLTKSYPGGIYQIVYEAGFCGFWALSKFREFCVDCIVVNPADRLKNRIKGLLYTKGISIPAHLTGNSRWSHSFMEWLKEIKFNTDAGNFTLRNPVLQLQQFREHNKNALRALVMCT